MPVAGRKRKKDAHLLGLGLDGPPKPLRVTRGENFHLVGGSKETHEQMQESCIKLNEKLDARGKRLGDLERQELRDLAAECKMNLVIPDHPDVSRPDPREGRN